MHSLSDHNFVDNLIKKSIVSTTIDENKVRDWRLKPSFTEAILILMRGDFGKVWFKKIVS